MTYKEACGRMQEIYASLKDGDMYSGTGYSNPTIQAAIHEYFPRRLVTTHQDNWFFTNEVTDLGPFVKEPTDSKSLIMFAHVQGDYYKEGLASMEPYHHKMLVIDQTEGHIIPEGDYALLRPTMRLTLFELQNWLMMYCRRRGIPYQGYCHSDLIAHHSDVWARMECIADNTTSGTVFSNYDTLALYKLGTMAKVGFFDEQFKTYYGDVDWYNRARYHDIHYCEMVDHGVEHKVSQTIKTSSPERQKLWHAEIAESMQRYMTKWGGKGHVPLRDETFVRPYGLA
jgi:hypothetical protein